MKKDPTDTRTLKEPRGLIRIIHAHYYLLTGLPAIWRHEASFRQITLLNATLLPLACLFDVTPSQQLLLMCPPVGADA